MTAHRCDDCFQPFCDRCDNGCTDHGKPLCEECADYCPECVKEDRNDDRVTESREDGMRDD